MDISIIVPVFHEEKNIKKVLSKITKFVKSSHEILVVYDTPTDPTFPIVKEYKKNHKEIRLIKNNIDTGRGVMNAIKTGFADAKGKATVVVMADLSDDISQIDKMYALIQKGNSIVCASRFMKGGKKIGGTLLKNLLSKFADISLHFLIGLPTHDGTNAYKMYSREFLQSINIESVGGFEYSLEITLKAFFKDKQITEIPTVWKDREAGKSNFQLRKWLPQYIKWYMWGLKEKFSLSGAYLGYILLAFFITLLYLGDQFKNKISVTSGLDLSWQTDAVERLLHGYIAGKDYIFTYGPLFQFFDSLPALLWHVSSYVSVPLAQLFSCILVSIAVIYISSKVAENKTDKYLLPPFLLFLLGVIPFLSGNLGIRLFAPFVYALMWFPMVFSKKSSIKRNITLSFLPSLFGLYVYDLFPQTVLLGGLFGLYILVKGKSKFYSRVMMFSIYLFGVAIFQIFTSFMISGGFSYLRGSLVTLSDYYYIMNTSWEFGKSNYVIIFPIVMLSLLFVMHKTSASSLKTKTAIYILSTAALMQLRTALIRSDSGHILAALFPSIIVTFILLFHLFKTNKVIAAFMFILLFTLIPFNTQVYQYLSGKNIKKIMQVIYSRKTIVFEDLYSFPNTYQIHQETRTQLFDFISAHKGQVMVYPYDSILLNSQQTTYNTYALQFYDYSNSYVEQRTVKELKNSPPKYIVLQIDGKSTFALDGMANFSRNPLVAEWMIKNYSVYAKIGDVLILTYNPLKHVTSPSQVCRAINIEGNFNHASLLNSIKPDLVYVIGGGAFRLPVKPNTSSYLIVLGNNSLAALEQLFNSRIDFSKKIEYPALEKNINIVSINILNNVYFFSNFKVYCYQ